LNQNNQGPGLELDLTNTIANPYIDENGDTYKILYPNNSKNMLDRLIENIDYYDQSTLPEWMTSNQPDANNPNGFSNPLGFVKAVVLAYTVPGASKLIAYRLRNSGITFNNIDFAVDRYLLDDYYTKNFDTTTKTYILGTETTFDALPRNNIGEIRATVDYAVQVPFSQINGRLVSYINNAGGLDGSTFWQEGNTLIFAKQENYLNPGPYQGWVKYTDSFIGDSILTSTAEGYDAGSYDTYSVVPGFLEKSQDPSVVNQRGGTWKITIVNNIVILVPVLEIVPNNKVRILRGTTYSGAILYYNQNLLPGYTVPYYEVFKYKKLVDFTPTTFNNNTTRFFSYRDSYYTPNTQDKYVKFPQYGVFN
jgi:hypothetical protein